MACDHTCCLSRHSQTTIMPVDSNQRRKRRKITPTETSERSAVDSVEATHDAMFIDKFIATWKCLRPHVCCICSSSIYSEAIIACSNVACEVTVHPGCYGMKHFDMNQTFSTWRCEKCRRSDTDIVACVLCPERCGDFYRTADIKGAWIHAACARWLPGVRFNEAHCALLSKIPFKYWNKRCHLCKDPAQALEGACVSCAVAGCEVSFHVGCARAAGLPIVRRNGQEQPPQKGRVFLCPEHRIPMKDVPMDDWTRWSVWVEERERGLARFKQRQYQQILAGWKEKGQQEHLRNIQRQHHQEMLEEDIISGRRILARLLSKITCAKALFSSKTKSNVTAASLKKLQKTIQKHCKQLSVWETQYKALKAGASPTTLSSHMGKTLHSKKCIRRDTNDSGVHVKQDVCIPIKSTSPACVIEHVTEPEQTASLDATITQIDEPVEIEHVADDQHTPTVSIPASPVCRKRKASTDHASSEETPDHMPLLPPSTTAHVQPAPSLSIPTTPVMPTDILTEHSEQDMIAASTHDTPSPMLKHTNQDTDQPIITQPVYSSDQDTDTKQPTSTPRVPRTPRSAASGRRRRWHLTGSHRGRVRHVIGPLLCSTCIAQISHIEEVASPRRSSRIKHSIPHGTPDRYTPLIWGKACSRCGRVL